MRCTCAHARREARAEAFREAADWCDDWAEEHTSHTAVAHTLRVAGAAFAARAKAATSRQPDRRDSIVDCVEDDGFVTVHPPTWPSEDGGLDG